LTPPPASLILEGEKSTKKRALLYCSCSVLYTQCTFAAVVNLPLVFEMFKENFKNASKLGNCQGRIIKNKLHIFGYPFGMQFVRKNNTIFGFRKNYMYENVTKVCDNRQ
jgi:hypothetical protein